MSPVSALPPGEPRPLPNGTALKFANHEHVRALAGAPALTDPLFDQGYLRSVFAQASVIWCNPSLDDGELVTLRSYSPNAKLYAGIPHSYPWQIGVGSEWWDTFRARLKPWIEADGFSEYREGLAAVEQFVAVGEDMTRGFDGVGWDELWYEQPDWISQRWATRGVAPLLAKARWRRCRDHHVACLTRPAMFNTGSASREQAAIFAPHAITVESQFGNVAAIASALVPFQHPDCVCWLGLHDEQSAVSWGPLQLDGLILRGGNLPTGIPR